MLRLRRQTRPLIYCLLALLTVVLCWVGSPGMASPLHPGSPASGPAIASSAETLEEQGRSLYQQGHYADAAVVFLQAARQYQLDGNRLQQAIALSNRALACQHVGRWAEANQAIEESLGIVQAEPQENERAHRWSQAQVLDIQGHLLLAQGQSGQSLEVWEQAAELYEQLGQRDRILANQVNQAQALQSLGLYRRAATLLSDALTLELTDLSQVESPLQHIQPSSGTIAALQSLGEVLRVIGNLQDARTVLQKSLDMAQTLQQPEAIAAAQFRLANVTRTEAFERLTRVNLSPTAAVDRVRRSQQGDRRRGIQDAEHFYTTLQDALHLYQQVTQTSTSPLLQLQANLNQLRVLIEIEQWDDAGRLTRLLQQQFAQLPTSRSAIYAQINFAQSLVKLSYRSSSALPYLSSSKSSHGSNQFSGNAPEAASDFFQAAQLLSKAVQEAKSFQDVRAESYALGNLGNLYEQVHQFEEAQDLTQRALQLAQAHNALDIAYRWQWQLGRLLEAEAKQSGSLRSHPLHAQAIASYTEAVKTLKSIRSDLVAITPDEQFSFRDTIEPIYREFVALLLAEDGASDQSKLRTAREVIESLQLAELDNFFREACLTRDVSLIDQVDTAAAIFYPIILPDQLAVIVSLPESSGDRTPPRQTLHSFTVPVSQQQVETTARALQDSLNQPNDERFLSPAQTLYDWLIRPVQAELDPDRVQTLVFVLDGALRDIPIPVLHDGQRYLVEQPYSIALTPGLQLLQPQFSDRRSLQSALLAGITEARPGFSALPKVRDELVQIQAVIPRTRVLLDEDPPRQDGELAIDGGFTRDNFYSALQSAPFPVVHLATHGQFSSQIDETFILTGDSRLNIENLKELLQTTTFGSDPVDLLVLSACETASGDRRAALGLAGVAVRAGAQSTLATLWNVNDQASSVFMGQFYSELVQPNAEPMTKARALQNAQRSLLQDSQYRHPYFWAAYVLIGNWQ